ncbi:tape measure protein [Brachybacterium alimentarium]|uniref:tape measure protein n=1 Tax=Brachybacterium alimentarium TaxID=47845 RepID=UPI003FD5148F
MSNMLSRAYIELIPSLKGAGKVIQKELQEITGTSFAPKTPIVPKAWSQQIQDVGRQWQSAGQDITKVGSALTKGITVPALGAVTAVGGVTAALGWKRLTSVDTAKGQLKGLGYSAQDVERISGQLSEALEGGMMTMGEATSAAASGMAAGVSEGKELTRYIQLLDAAVVGGNGTFDEMNQIFSRIVDQGRLTRTEFDMISQRMPGFSGAVQEAMGVSSDEMYKMLSAGEITSDEFLDIMDDFAGDMATAYAETWEGMVQNTWAYVGIIGEALLGGVFEQSKESINEFLEFLSSDEVLQWAENAGVAIGDAFSVIIEWVKSAIDWWNGLSGETKKMIGVIAGVAVAAGPVIMVIGKIVSVIGSLMVGIGTVAGSPLGGWLAKMAGKFGLLSGAKGIGGLASKLLRFAGPVGIVVSALIAMWTQSEAFREAVMDLASAVGDLLMSVFEALMPLIEVVIDVVGMLMGVAMDLVATLADALAPVIEIVAELLTALTEGALVPLVEFITAVLVPIIEFLAEMVRIAFEEIAAIISGVMDIVMGIIDVALGLITGDWDKAWSGMQKILDGIMGIILGIISGVVARMEAVINAVLSAIGMSWTGAWQAISSFMSGILGRIGSSVSGAMSSILNWISNAWSRAKSTTVNAWNGMRTAVSNGIIGVVNYVRGLPGRVLSALGNIGSLLLGSGRALVDGFTQGIKNAFGKAVDAVKNGVQRVRNFFPFSPAKEGPLSGHGYTSYSGRALVSDFAEGMAAAEADVVRQAESITRAAAFDAPSMPAATLSAVPASAQESGARGGVTNEFHITNPVAEPTSETARKASAYIGVSV